MSNYIAGRRFTERERQRCLESYRSIGLTQRQFAARAGIGFSTLALWLRKERRSPGPCKSTFLELSPFASAFIFLFLPPSVA